MQIELSKIFIFIYWIKFMAYLIPKIFIAFLIIGNIAALQTHEQTLPNDNMGNYTNKNCCPQGYNVAG